MAKGSSKKKSGGKKVKASFTNTKGQKVVSYTDGSKKVTGQAQNPGSGGYKVGGKSYASAKDAPGYYDSGMQFEARDGTGFDDRASAKAYNKTLTASPMSLNGLLPQQSMNLPSAMTVTDPGAPTLAMSPQLQSLGFSMNNGQYAYDPKKSEAQNAFDESAQKQQQNMLWSVQQMLGLQPQSAEKDYLKMEKEAGIKKLESQVSGYTSELNNIVAERDANLLRLEGQGRGIPEVIIGGQQAQVNKEAAIRALPVQAQLDAAQGNLQMAQSRLDKLFTIRQQDIQTQYNFKKSVIDAVSSFVTKQEEGRLQFRLSEIQQQQQMQASNLARVDSLSRQALEFGQTGLAGRVAALDPKSPTFAQDYMALQVQLRKPAPVVAPRAPTMQNFGTADAPDWRQYDYTTGTWKPASGVDNNNPNSPAQKTQIAKNEALTLARELRSDGAVGKQSAVGASVGKFFDVKGVLSASGLQPNRAAFEAKVETLKANLTIDNLKLLKGAMSDKDLAFLQSAGSSLNVNMSEKEFNNELDRIITKFEKAGAQSENQSVAEGATYVWNGVTYKVINGQWVSQ